jgi:UDP-N-acetylglucosamine 1-carboxyvinyltransferase
MDAYRVSRSEPLNGEVEISGAKNAVLPMMAATLLAKGVSVIRNVPNLKDVRTMADVLRVVGARVKFTDGVLEVDTTAVSHYEAPYELVKTMRASIYVLGPLLAHFGEARVSLPGGCAWGPRPVDLHIKGMEELGAKVTVTHGYIEARASELTGAHIFFQISSVGATANVLMAAVLASGTTILDNAAVEPEIDNLADFLNSMGARITGIGTRTLHIEGVPALKPGVGTTIPDRIEAGTFLAAGAITRGKVRVTRVEPGHLKEVTRHFVRMGLDLSYGPDWIELDARHGVLHPVNVVTQPYPGFPTDMQAQVMALLTTVSGNSTVQDTIYPDRFKHLSELDRLGAEIQLHGDTAFITGGQPLSAAPVMASDLRASAALVLAGLVAEGTTLVTRIYHMDRGYELFEAKLAKLGGLIQRVREGDEGEPES